MPTYAEINARHLELLNLKAILSHVQDHLDTNFRSFDGSPPKVLLADNKLPVPDESFETVSASLSRQIEDLDREIDGILRSTLEEGNPSE